MGGNVWRGWECLNLDIPAVCARHSCAHCVALNEDIFCRECAPRVFTVSVSALV